MQTIEEILVDLGFNLQIDKNGWRSNRIYANGDNYTSLLIYKDGSFIDFVEGKRGSLKDLILLTKKFKTIDEVNIWLKNKNFNYLTPLKIEPKIKIPKIYNKDVLTQLLPIYDFYTNKGIDINFIKKLQCGVAVKGQMKDRFVFPIFNDKEELIGFAGRDITHKSNVKWKILGTKNNFVYNSYLFDHEIRMNNSVILVESIGDFLALNMANIHNILVLFGVELNLSIINYLLRLNIEKIIISLNNDHSKNNAGNHASIKIYSKLAKYFNKQQLSIILPNLKDWGEVFEKEGQISINKQLC